MIKQDNTAADNAITQQLDGGNMTTELFNAIVHCWKMSNLFLTKYLRRSMDTVKSYRYGRLPIPQAIADKMRRLHVFLAMED